MVDAQWTYIERMNNWELSNLNNQYNFILKAPGVQVTSTLMQIQDMKQLFPNFYFISFALRNTISSCFPSSVHLTAKDSDEGHVPDVSGPILRSNWASAIRRMTVLPAGEGLLPPLDRLGEASGMGFLFPQGPLPFQLSCSANICFRDKLWPWFWKEHPS